MERRSIDLYFLLPIGGKNDPSSIMHLVVFFFWGKNELCHETATREWQMVVIREQKRRLNENNELQGPSQLIDFPASLASPASGQRFGNWW